MSIDIGQWRASIGNFNSNQCILHGKNGSSINFVGNLFIYRLEVFIFIYHLFELLFDYSDYPTNVLKCILFCFLISNDNITVQVFNLLSSSTIPDKKFKNLLKRMLYILQYFMSVKYFIEIFLNLFLQHGDIETNPGPRTYHSQYFSFCHWNLNSLPAHNYSKVPLLQAFNALHKFDLICLSESYLNSSITMDEKSLIIDGYKLIRADHPSDTRRGGVCIYHKETMSVKVLNFSQLSECLVCEISIQNKKGYFVTLYRSPSQSYDDFEIFLKEFEKLLTNITKKKKVTLS